MQTPLTFRACSHHPSCPEPPPPTTLPLLTVGVLRLYLFFLNVCLYSCALVFFPAFLLPSNGIFSSLRSETVVCSACLPDTPCTCTGVWEGGRRSPGHWCPLGQALAGVSREGRAISSQQRRLEGVCFLLTDRNFRGLGSLAQVHSFSKVSRCVWSTGLLQGGLQSLVLRTAG